jgi:hypothetical protein
VGRGGVLTALDRGLEVAWAVDDGGQGLRWRSDEGLRSGEEISWTRGAQMVKQDHRATAEPVLRPREALCM